MMSISDMPFGYKIDTRIRDLYHMGFNRSDSGVSHFIIHGTAGGNKAEDCLSWMLKGGDMGGGVYRREQYKKGIALFQYMIDRSGEIIELINPHNYVYHSSTGSFDLKTIGVELINPDRNNGGKYTEEQYKALTALYKFLQQRFSEMKTIQGHGSIKMERTKSGKVCPGLGFDWASFRGLLIGAHFNINSIKEKIKVA